MAGGSKTTVTSKGKKSENEKRRAYQEAAAKMKQKAGEDEQKVKEARKKATAGAATAQASGGSALNADTLKGIGAAVAAGVAATASGKAKNKFKNTLILILVVLLVLAGLFIYLKYIAPDNTHTPVQSIAGGLTHTDLDFQNAILGESREQMMYVVFEQDVEVESTVSQKLLNLDIFNKTKTIHSTGTGYYAVDMSKLSEDSVAVDNDNQIVTVTIPHAVLYTVKYDVANSTFEDTENALLAFGDMKLTMEQQNEIQKSIDATLNETLNDPALFAEADEIALLKVRELFQPVVAKISDQYLVAVAFAE